MRASERATRTTTTRFDGAIVCAVIIVRHFQIIMGKRKERKAKQADGSLDCLSKCLCVCVCACQWQKSCQRAAVLSAGGCRRWQRCGLNDNDDRGAATEAISFLLSLLKSLVYFLFSNSISCRPIFATLIRLPNQRPKRPLLSV